MKMQGQDLWAENVVLLDIVSLHPDHLTTDELVMRLEGRSPVPIWDALHALRRSGLVRLNGEVVEPTYAAIRATDVFGEFET